MVATFQSARAKGGGERQLERTFVTCEHHIPFSEILAIIPPWSGTKGFHGYARDNIGQGPVAWELGSDNVLFERFKQAQSYWQKSEDNEFWPSIQASQISQLEKIFGHHAKYYAIDGGRWPPSPGHTLPCDSWQNSNLTMALLLYAHSGTPRIALEQFLGDPVNLLWFVPISEEERQVAIDQGSEQLASRLPHDRWKQA